MCVRYLGCVFLAWLPCLIQAQNLGQPCPSPVLGAGYFVPEQQEYTNGTTLTYACDTGHKPVVEGWWATSTCQNGKWSHTPQCIDEHACLPPTIPNGKYTESPNGWYEENQSVTVTCNDGYKLKRRGSTTVCTNSLWSPVLGCEKMTNACTEPPKIPHAVIINQTPQEVYPENSRVQYECEDGYSITNSYSNCRAGQWTEGPRCTADCVIHPTTQLDLKQTSAVHLKEGVIQYIPCKWNNYSRPFLCSNRRIKTSHNCCHNRDIYNGYCGPETLLYELQ